MPLKKSKLFTSLFGLWAIFGNTLKTAFAETIAVPEVLWFLDALDGKVDGLFNRPDVSLNSPNVRVYVIDPAKIDASHAVFAYGPDSNSIIVDGPTFNYLNFTKLLVAGDVLTGMYDAEKEGIYKIETEIKERKYKTSLTTTPISKDELVKYSVVGYEHSTALASIIGGFFNGMPMGVAGGLPDLNLISVATGLEDVGTAIIDILHAIQWSTNDCEKMQHADPKVRCVFNLSVAVNKNLALQLAKIYTAAGYRGIDSAIIRNRVRDLANTATYDAIVQALIMAAEKGIGISIAAGNEGRSACQENFLTNILLKYPANKNAGPIFVVGAINAIDEIAGFSNLDQCVNVVAPGVGIVAAYPGVGGTTLTLSIEGTSYATAIISGIMAILFKMYPTMPEMHSAIEQMLHSKDMYIAKTAGAYAKADQCGATAILPMLLFSQQAKPGLTLNEAYDNAVFNTKYKHRV